MRVFVALDIPDAVRSAIREFTAKLAPLCRGARWTRVEGVHVTLKYIGEVSPEKVERIKAELAGVRSTARVDLRFRGVGFFPNEKHPRVFWAGIEATLNLAEIAVEIETRMERLGIAREQREFRPHLTLARLNSEEGLPRLREAIAKTGAFEFGGMSTGELHLIESHLKPGGAEYAKLATFAFAETPR